MIRRTRSVAGHGGVIVAAKWHGQGLANRADTVAGGLMNVLDHLPKLTLGQVPRIIAAFLKNLLFLLKRPFSRCNARRSCEH